MRKETGYRIDAYVNPKNIKQIWKQKGVMSADVIEICEIGIKANIMFERHDIISQLTVN